MKVTIMTSRKRIYFTYANHKVHIFELLNTDMRRLPHNDLFNILYTYSFMGDYLFLTR